MKYDEMGLSELLSSVDPKTRPNFWSLGQSLRGLQGDVRKLNSSLSDSYSGCETPSFLANIDVEEDFHSQITTPDPDIF